MNNNFGISEEQMKALVAEGLRSGGSWCDLYFESTVYFDLLLRDSEVSSGGYHQDYGCGIRVLDGEKTGYAYSESTDYASLLNAARAASSIACGSSSAPGIISPAAGKRRADAQDRYPQESDWRQKEASFFVPVLKKIDTEIHRRESRADKVVAMLSWSLSDIMMYNSLGELSCDSRPLGSISVSTVFSKDGRIENRRVSRSFRCGAEMISDTLVEELISDSVKGVDAMFEAKRPKGGKMNVVMAAGASGILLHEAMGHAFEADFNRKGQSVFCDRMGKRICNKGINIVDDATIRGNRGSCNFDDEGVPGQKTYMVTDGILTSYLHDRISASWFGVEPTGNGRRESFRYNPIPRMRATYMESGSDGSLDDLVGSVRKGIFVDQFANGQVKIGEGDFTFYVKSGFLIENGQLTRPVKDINIIGNGPQALADIVAVADDLKIDNGTWTCGKEQSVPVSCGIPSVLVKGLTVGGN
ncbi:MAG: TldD/PmbA family protein [Bacteroidales bacterium]|nr:TldD/PmbA family protein [Bacteroidales bacterium]